MSDKLTHGTLPKNTSIQTPKELHCLSDSSQLVLTHIPKIIEELCACEVKQIFTVYNRLPEVGCCAHCRRYEYIMTDCSRKDLIYFWHCTDCCACLQKLEVLTPPNLQIGTITENCTLCRASFTVRSPDNEVQAEVKGPMCCSCFASGNSNMHFEIFVNNILIGTIGRGIVGLDRKFPKSGYVTVTYPHELDVKTKALVLGAAVLVYFVYYYPGDCGKTFWIVNIST